ncbi:MAG: methionyl-tRNA formyltransferase [Parcubacteria group bacterium CG10_big_fil_rev_8_21_14_0_10_38_31]|nr:MAG: methionyl-tRNA formyltransferase [Parcubacteria group bacterium CG10_big_fil_rev_8_21_14_0_10_38_31]
MTDKPNKLKIAFLGTPEFAIKILEEMKKGGLTPSLIITTPDKPKGRKLALTPPPVKMWADKEKILTLQPNKLNDIYTDLKKGDWDLFVLAAFGKIIPKEIVDIPKHGILNVHPSILPEYRGPSPIQSAILSGDTELGVTIMLLDEELDHGPIIATEKLPLSDNLNYEEAEEKLAKLGGKLLVRVALPWTKEKIKTVEQDHKRATFTVKVKKDDALIDWNDNPEIIERRIRAFYPWPGAYFFLDKDGKPFRVIVTKASLKGDKLHLEKVKPEGKNEMTFSDFIKGNPELKLQIPGHIL